MGCGHCGEAFDNYEDHWRKYPKNKKSYCPRRWIMNKNGTEIFNEGKYIGKRG